jgi:hypothetical protein
LFSTLPTALLIGHLVDRLRRMVPAAPSTPLAVQAEGVAELAAGFLLISSLQALKAE